MLFNGAQIHLLVNHLPVIGFLGMVLALAVAIKVQSVEVKRFILLATILVGASAMAPYWTGEFAEKNIEHLSGVSKSLIHDHEELAETATIFSVITAIAAAVAFFFQRRRSQTMRISIPIVLALSLVTAGLMSAAAHEGGKIRHPEINPAVGISDSASNGTSKTQE